VGLTLNCESEVVTVVSDVILPCGKVGLLKVMLEVFTFFYPLPSSNTAPLLVDAAEVSFPAIAVTLSPGR
jgi:hypothetical protein